MNSGNYWSEREKNEVYELASLGVKHKDIACRLGRSKYAIEIKISEKIEKDLEKGEGDFHTLCQLYNIDEKKVKTCWERFSTKKVSKNEGGCIKVGAAAPSNFSVMVKELLGNILRVQREILEIYK